VSAIVPAPVLNERGRRCLQELVRLEDVEVIFVADGATEGAPEGVCCLESGPAMPGVKRQLGLERSQGEVIALIDDDAYPHPDWLRYALAELDADPAVGAVSGPTLTPPDAPLLEELGGLVYASPLVSGPHRWRYATVAARDVDDAPTVNLVVRREDALAIGLDSAFQVGEDTVICERLIKRGRRIRYVPQAIVFHARRPLWRPHLRQLWKWSRHRGSFARRGGVNSLRPSYFAPSTLLVAVASGPVLRGSLRRLWSLGLVGYLGACAAAGADRDPRRWVRVSGAIVATHATYGVGFLLGFGGVRVSGQEG
jgi:hypothetical protein